MKNATERGRIPPGLCVAVCEMSEKVVAGSFPGQIVLF
jgi:hypothetical protein